MWERKDDLVSMIREQGSRTEQQYGEKPGKASTHYVPAVPSWFMSLEDTERVEYELWCTVFTVKRLLEYLQTHEQDLYNLYALKYRGKAPVPELKRHFDRKLGRLDRDLIFTLIHWHGWPIDKAGGAEFESWLQKRGF